ncbi:HAAS signaling domain-containing protein [Aureivirga sp. CE67]|uniref:HAAS signaling domain-containing protein n=1 Tax=Aureivirga sp. CE67 TaxID=1788983 RepID=UPI0018CBCF97|nr:DUF1700 domain-containing protein [Aureivirga sp. CE67]
MQSIKFEEKRTTQLYEKYLKELKKVVKKLNEEDRNEILNEVNSHIFEAYHRRKEENEYDFLNLILQKLGKPEEIFRNYVSDNISEEKSEETDTITKKVSNKMTIYFLNFIVSLIYVSSILLIITSYYKIQHPDQTGLFVENGEFRAIGIHTGGGPEVKEVLGNGLYFLTALFILVSFVLLRFKTKLIRKQK